MRRAGIKPVTAAQILTTPGLANDIQILRVNLAALLRGDAEGFKGFPRATGAEANFETTAG